MTYFQAWMKKVKTNLRFVIKQGAEINKRKNIGGRESPPGPADTPVDASGNTSRSRLQDLRPGGFAVFLPCRAPSSPTTCLFIPALPGLPVIRNTLKTVIEDGFRALAKLLDLTTPADRPLFFIRL